jgi:hypothetical protein
MRARVRRDGISWDLDLREGIDLYIYLAGRFEWGLSRILTSLVRPGDTVVDVGANVGAHALPLARAAGAEGRPASPTGSSSPTSPSTPSWPRASSPSRRC